MVNFIRAHGSQTLLFLAFVESLLFFGSFYVGVRASWVSFDGANAIVLAPKAAIFTAVLTAMMFAVGLYHRRFLSNLANMMARAAVATVLGAMILMAIFYVFPEVQIWRSVLLPAIALSLFGILVTRLVVRRLVGADLLRKRVAVIGVGKRAATIEKLERDGRAFGFTCVGFIDPGTETISVPRTRVIGGCAHLEDVLERERVDEVVIAADTMREPKSVHALIERRRRGMSVTRYNAFYERETGSVDIDAIDATDFVFADSFRGGAVSAGLKRALDVAVCLVFIVLFLPLFLATAIAIRLESAGPVILRQERVGQGGRTFVVLKFRSMHVDSERDGVPRWAANDDPRITRIGAFIRKVRIDELPQLINVMRGEMSFVGPRPEREYFVEQLASEIPFYGERHLVKPGITGWAQLNYQYGASIEDARRKLQYDLYYLLNQSLLLDIVIILQTVRVILWPQGVR